MTRKRTWLVKSEPTVYAYADLARDGRTVWDGIRNYAARLHLRAMKKGDDVLFYHSGDDKSVVGLATVVREAYPEVTKDDGDWSAVDLAAVRALAKPVPLATIKATKALAQIALVRQSRLSVMPLDRTAFNLLLKMGTR